MGHKLGSFIQISIFQQPCLIVHTPQYRLRFAHRAERNDHMLALFWMLMLLLIYYASLIIVWQNGSGSSRLHGAMKCFHFYMDMNSRGAKCPWTLFLLVGNCVCQHHTLVRKQSQNEVKTVQRSCGSCVTEPENSLLPRDTNASSTFQSWQNSQ